MPLSYYPRMGEILVCHYGQHVILPEMNKTRPVVVIGPRLRRRGELVGVIPLSTTAPSSVEEYHVRLELTTPLPAPFESTTMWAKCDMYASVSLARLDRFKQARSRYGGPRKWMSAQLSEQEIALLRRALLSGLGFAQD